MGWLLRRLLRGVGAGRGCEAPCSRDDVEHYLRVREALGDVYGSIIDTIPGHASREVAKALGMPDVELMGLPDGMNCPPVDCCVLEWTEDGRTMARRYAEDGPRPSDPYAREALDAMMRARFMLLRVKECLPGSGVTATDLLTEEELFVFDMSMSMTRSSDKVVIVGHVLPMGDHWMLTGGNTALSTEEARRLREDFEHRGRPLTPESLRRRETVYGVFRWCERHAEDVLMVTRDIAALCALAEGVERSMVSPGPESIPLPITPRRPARNAPCPCGSGRQYKRCCGSSRRSRRSA